MDNKLLHSGLTYILRGLFYEVNNQYGSGHKEIIYHKALIEKLKLKQISFESEKKLKIKSLDTGKQLGVYQPDLIIENKIIIESSDKSAPPSNNSN